MASSEPVGKDLVGGPWGPQEGSRTALPKAASPLPLEGSKAVGRGSCVVLGQAVVGWAEELWVSRGRVDEAPQSAQTASELLLAGRRVRLPATEQLVGGQ